MPEKKGGARGPYAKTSARRKAISTAALRALLEDGPENLTAANVAARTGFTQATVNYHYPSKDLLALAALSEADAEDKVLTDLGGLSLAEVAASLGRVILSPTGNANRLRAFTIQTANACDPSHPAHDWVLRHHLLVREGFADILRQLQDSGEAHPEVDPDQFGRQMVAIWEGLQVQWLIDPGFDLAKQVTEALWALTRAEVTQVHQAISTLVLQSSPPTAWVKPLQSSTDDLRT